MHELDLDPDVVSAAWDAVLRHVDARARSLREAPVVPSVVPDVERDLERPRDPVAVVERAAEALAAGVVPPGHPRYFGLFNPAPAALSVIADALVAAENPQLATRGHAPWAVAVDDAVIAALGRRFGYAEGEVGGVLTSGGSESNTTALLAALTSRFPEVGERGVRSLPSDPVAYVSDEGHATIKRAARVAGLGAQAVRVVPSGADHRMKPGALGAMIAEDRAAGRTPFFVVATVGTTSSGAIDPVPEIVAIGRRAGAWVHVDAAWGGLAALVPELAPRLDGVRAAESITFDPHKAMSAPMGTGVLLTRRPDVLPRVFAERTGYMPRDGGDDPYGRGMAWSRRFLGLRVYLPLLACGFEGFAASWRRRLALADALRAELRARDWEIVNDSPLPLVCFCDRERRDAKFLDAVARDVVGAGDGWISVPRFANGGRALRACVNNHRTEAGDVERLVAGLQRARAAFRG